VVPDFASHLRRLREEKGITRYRLAKLAGLSIEGACRLEEAGSDPKLSTLFKLAPALGVEPAELVPPLSAAGRKRK
jgi:transcriptional regulator with XRE-family HTH domain